MTLCFWYSLFLIYGPPDHLLLLLIYDIKLQIEIIIWVSSEVPAI